MAHAYNNLLGHAHWKLRDYKKALACYEKAYEIRKKTLGENHQDTKESLKDIREAQEALAKG